MSRREGEMSLAWRDEGDWSFALVKGNVIAIEPASGRWAMAGSPDEAREAAAALATGAVEAPAGGRVLVVRVTERCNLRCRYCYASAGEAGANEGPAVVHVTDVLQGMFRSDPRPVKVIFHGGEPFLNFGKVEEIVRGVRESGFQRVAFSIQTNGTILTPRQIGFLKSESFTVSISCDGDRESHDANRVFPNGKGSFALIERNIELLRKNGIPMAFNTVVSESSEPEKVVRGLEALGVRATKFVPCRSVGRAMEQGAEGREEVGNLRALSRCIEGFRRQNMGRSGVFCEGSSASAIYRIARLPSPLICDNRSCGAGTGMLMIDVAGRLFPCEEFHDRGDFVMNGPGSGASPAERPQAGSLRRHGGHCSRCRYRGLCAGYCPADVLRSSIPGSIAACHKRLAFDIGFSHIAHSR